MKRKEYSLAFLFLAVLIGGFVAIGLKNGWTDPAPRTVVHVVYRTKLVTPAPKVITRTILVTPSAAPQAASPPMPHVNGATHSMLVDCSVDQCTSLPGAGPNGGTCGAIVNNEQECVW
jgi:hypothetical protein